MRCGNEWLIGHERTAQISGQLDAGCWVLGVGGGVVAVYWKNTWLSPKSIGIDTRQGKLLFFSSCSDLSSVLSCNSRLFEGWAIGSMYSPDPNSLASISIVGFVPGVSYDESDVGPCRSTFLERWAIGSTQSHDPDPTVWHESSIVGNVPAVS
eukprot:scaffold1782_cov123-Isochrysis_galbana.AAC.4